MTPEQRIRIAGATLELAKKARASAQPAEIFSDGTPSAGAAPDLPQMAIPQPASTRTEPEKRPVPTPVEESVVRALKKLPYLGAILAADAAGVGLPVFLASIAAPHLFEGKTPPVPPGQDRGPFAPASTVVAPPPPEKGPTIGPSPLPEAPKLEPFVSQREHFRKAIKAIEEGKNAVASKVAEFVMPTLFEIDKNHPIPPNATPEEKSRIYQDQLAEIRNRLPEEVVDALFLGIGGKSLKKGEAPSIKAPAEAGALLPLPKTPPLEAPVPPFEVPPQRIEIPPEGTTKSAEALKVKAEKRSFTIMGEHLIRHGDRMGEREQIFNESFNASSPVEALLKVTDLEEPSLGGAAIGYRLKNRADGKIYTMRYRSLAGRLGAIGDAHITIESRPLQSPGSKPTIEFEGRRIFDRDKGEYGKIITEKSAENAPSPESPPPPPPVAPEALPKVPKLAEPPPAELPTVLRAKGAAEAPKAEAPAILRPKEAPELTLPEEPPFDPRTMGLSNAQENLVRQTVGLKDLAPADNRTFVESFKNAKTGKFDQNGLDVAAEVVKSKRPISDNELAGMGLKLADVKNEQSQSLRTISELIEKGDTKAAEIEQARLTNLQEQVNTLTEGMTFGKRENARALSIAQSFIDLDTYDYAGVSRRMEAVKGGRLNPIQTASITEWAGKYEALKQTFAETVDRFDREAAMREKLAAERVRELEAKKYATGFKKAIGKMEEIFQERQDIKKQIAALGYRMNDISGLTSEGAYLVGRLATNYFKEAGANLSLDGLVKKIQSDFPELTERDVWRALNEKNPKLQERAKVQATTQLVELKKQAQQLLEFDAEIDRSVEKRWAEGKPPEPEVIRDLQGRLRDMRVQAYKSGIETQKLERALQTINELQDQLANQYRAIKEKRPIEAPELQAAREKVALLRKTMRVQDELAKVNDQIRTGEFEIKEPPEPKPIPPELERIQIALKRQRKIADRMVAEAKPVSLLHAVARIPVRVAEESRTAIAAIDISATARQGFVGYSRLLFTDPAKAGQIFGQSLQTLFSKYKAEQLYNSIIESPNYYIKQGKMKIKYSELDGPVGSGEEFFAGRLVEKIPGYGRLIQASNRHMTTTLNLIRDAIAEEFLRNFPNATTSELKAWGNWINTGSGRGGLGKFELAARELGTVFFAPRLAASRIQTPFKILQYWKEPRIRAEIAKDYVRMAAVGGSAMTLAYLVGADVTLNPRDPDFGKIRFGDTRFDVWAGFLQPMRLIWRLGMAATDKTGLTGGDLPKDLREYNNDPLETLGRFAAYKFSPLVTIPRELIRGKTAVGDNVTPLETAAQAVIPLAWKDIYEAWQDEQGVPALAIPASLSGIGVSTYRDSKKTLKLKRFLKQ